MSSTLVTGPKMLITFAICSFDRCVGMWFTCNFSLIFLTPTVSGTGFGTTVD